MWLSEDPTSSKGEGGRGAANPSPFMKKWVHSEGHTFDLCPNMFINFVGNLVSYGIPQLIAVENDRKICLVGFSCYCVFCH